MNSENASKVTGDLLASLNSLHLNLEETKTSLQGAERAKKTLDWTLLNNTDDLAAQTHNFRKVLFVLREKRFPEEEEDVSLMPRTHREQFERDVVDRMST
jgi:hypothetical protein